MEGVNGGEKPRVKGRFALLLLSLVLLLVLYPYTESLPAGRTLLTVVAGAIPMAGVYAVSQRRSQLVVAILLGLPAIGASLLTLGRIDSLASAPMFVFPALFFLFAVSVMLGHVLRPERVTADTLFGAACIYLLLGLTWAMLHALLESLVPGSFAVPGSSARFADLLYFSFVTLTTVGYGDVTPVTAGARSLAILESVTGVLYVAILIARLVGMYRSPPGRGETV